MTKDFLYKFICWCSERDIDVEGLWFKSDDGGGPFFKLNKPRHDPILKVYINCNDYFEYACADAEEITEENFPLLEEAYYEILNHPVKFNYENWIEATCYCFNLYCVKVRKQPPLDEYLKVMNPELRKIFNKSANMPEDHGSGEPQILTKNKDLLSKLPFYFGTNEQFVPGIDPCYIMSALGNVTDALEFDREWIYINDSIFFKEPIILIRNHENVHLPTDLKLVTNHYIETKQFGKISWLIKSLWGRNLNWDYKAIDSDVIYTLLEATHSIKDENPIKIYRDALITNISWNRPDGKEWLVTIKEVL